MGSVLAAVVLLAVLAFMVSLQLSVPRVERVEAPERALSLMVGRMLDMEDGMAELPAWERFLYEGAAGSGLNELEQAMAWYDELRAVSPDPVVGVEGAILQGEAGHIDRVQTLVREWSAAPAPYPIFARVLDGAYLVPRLAPDDAMRVQAELADILPDGWFYDHVAMRLAARAGDRRLETRRKDAIQARATVLISRVRRLTAAELLVFCIGIPATILLLRRDRTATAVGTAPLPPAWPGRLGVAVLLRGGAAGLLLTLAFLYLNGDTPLVRVFAMPIAGLPLLWLARRYLLAPAGLDLVSGFGFRVERGAWGRLLLALSAVLAVGFLGEWIMGVVAESWQLSSHWTEWFDADLVWGDGSLMAVSLLEFVVFAPALEELTFRGLLYATLRRRFGFGTASLISAGMFAAAHGYGVLGFASVLWSGILWAWVYERTGSLWPGMLAHALNNLLVCLTVLWLLRY